MTITVDAASIEQAYARIKALQQEVADLRRKLADALCPVHDRETDLESAQERAAGVE